MNKPTQTHGADRRLFHVIYKTTCLITDKYYIGMHSTDDLADGYMGSGKRLWYSLNKHGHENHICEILEHLPNREALRLRERELVTVEIVGDPLCMNLALGGGHIYNTAQTPYIKVKQRDGIRLFWSSPAGLELRDKMRGQPRPFPEASKAKAAISAKLRMARMKADGSWDLVVAKNKASHAGKILSEEHKHAISKGGQRYKELHGKKVFSEQAIANISTSLVGNDRNKKVWTLTDLNSQHTFQIANVSRWCRDNGYDSSTCYILDPSTKAKLFVVLERQLKLEATKDTRNAAKRLRRASL